jgi:hypothetical protein
MNPELTGFALGLLLGAAKVLAIATVGFAYAWWKARNRVKSLEAELQEADRLPAATARLLEIEQKLDRISRHLEESRRLPPG